MIHERFGPDERKLFKRLEVVGRNTGNPHVRQFCEDIARQSQTAFPITRGQWLYARSVIREHFGYDR